MMKTQQESVNICTVVSFDTSLRCESKIAIAHTVGSMVTLTTLGSVTRDGMNIIPSPDLRRMLELSGLLETEERLVTGDKVKKIQHEN